MAAKHRTLGRMEPVELREVWAGEATDFTPWLGREENLAQLGDTLGLNLELEAEEQEVGRFQADLLCRDTATDQWVLIENQLERTDHSHLAQLLTYSAGLDAVTVVCIAARFTEEHRATLDWLNEVTVDEFNFFGLEMELWRIGDSPVAPKFNVVCKPNDWTKSLQRSTRVGLTENRKLQLEYWTTFREFMAENSHIKCQKPQPANWMNHPVGRTGFHLNSVASFWDSESGKWGGEIRVELVVDHQQSKSFFAALQDQRDAVEGEIGSQLTWHAPEGKRMCRAYLRKSVDIANRESWPEQHDWLRANLEAFHSAFEGRVRKLALAEVEGGGETNL